MPRIPNFVAIAPQLPGPVAGGEPLLASSLDGIGVMLNGYLGWQALATFARVHLVGDLHYDGIGADLDAENLRPPFDEPPTVIAPPPIRFRRTAGARYVGLIGWQVAHEGLVKHEGDEVESILKARLQSTDGDLLDGPIVWSITNGYLATVETALGEVLDDAWRAPPAFPGGDHLFDPDDPLLAGAWLRHYRHNGATPEQVFQTGWSADAVGTEPRMLAYPDDCPDVVELAFEAVGVRVYAVCVMEVYQEEIG